MTYQHRLHIPMSVRDSAAYRYHLGRSAMYVTAFFFLVASAVSSWAQTPTVLDSFAGGSSGAAPQGVMVQGTDGMLYGTAGGGVGGGYGNGTVFKMSPSGVLTTLYAFCAQPNCPDGNFPDAGLVEGTDGNFYGMTNSGGSHSAGTVYKITPEGSLTTIYNFCSQPSCADGGYPDYGSLLLDRGYFYRTTRRGGLVSGTLFKIDANGDMTTLH